MENTVKQGTNINIKLIQPKTRSTETQTSMNKLARDYNKILLIKYKSMRQSWPNHQLAKPPIRIAQEDERTKLPTSPRQSFRESKAINRKRRRRNITVLRKNGADKKCHAEARRKEDLDQIFGK